jgi:hypothetical protein
VAGNKFTDLNFGIEVTGKKSPNQGLERPGSWGDRVGQSRHPGTNTLTSPTAERTPGSP